MSSRVRAITGALFAAMIASLAFGSAHAGAKVTVGFADSKPSIFSDPRLPALGVKTTRIDVPWDVLTEPNTLPYIDAYMAGAKMLGVKPLITLDRSFLDPKKNPTNAQMALVIKAFRARWGTSLVSTVSTWNEGNINKNPKLVAGWYVALKKACPSCTILGADVVDKSNEVAWTKSVIAAVKKLHGPKVKVWGLHNYVDVNNLKTTNTVKFAKAIPGDLWLTETGGVVNRLHPGSHFKGKGTAFQKSADDFLLNKLLKTKGLSKIKRVYLYSWSSAPNDLTWDSGVIAPDGTERPALAVIRKYTGHKTVPAGPFAPVPASNVIVTPTG